MNNNFNFDDFIKPYDIYVPVGDPRRAFYEHACNFLVSLNRPVLIVETGAMWSIQGAFTLVFADLIKNWTGGRIITVDISEEHLNLAKENTKEFSDVISYILSDSVSYLKSISTSMADTIDLLYLDSFDLDVFDPMPSQIHHLRELISVYDNLRLDALIGVDDNLMPGNWTEWKHPDGRIEIFSTEKDIVGKGTLVDRFLRDNGWILFNNNYPYTLLGYYRN